MWGGGRGGTYYKYVGRGEGGEGEGRGRGVHIISMRGGGRGEWEGGRGKGGREVGGEGGINDKTSLHPPLTLPPPLHYSHEQSYYRHIYELTKPLLVHVFQQCARTEAMHNLMGCYCSVQIYNMDVKLTKQMGKEGEGMGK